jgi:hypothetical protein
MNDVNRFPVQVERKNLRECYAGPVDAELNKALWQWGRCAHNVAADTLKRILLHGDESTVPPPSRIAIGMRQVLRRNHNVANRGVRTTR